MSIYHTNFTPFTEQNEKKKYRFLDTVKLMKLREINDCVLAVLSVILGIDYLYKACTWYTII